MNKDEFLNWVYATEEHLNALNRIIEDRILLKSVIESHLKEFFSWDEIEYNKDFSEVTLIVFDDFIIDSDKLSGLLMNWSIEPYGDDCFKIIVYPFGVPNEEDDM